MATEETWHNPSILLATITSSEGKVVFSQIHLEVDPTQYEYEEDKFKALKESNIARLEIISDLLSTHLGMEIKDHTSEAAIYTPAYFLGRYEVYRYNYDHVMHCNNKRILYNNYLKVALS